MSDLFEKRSSKIIVYVFMVYIIILSLLTFTDMANVFANSIGLRIAFSGAQDITSNTLRGILAENPAMIRNYDFRPNVVRFILYLFIGLFIVYLINTIESKGDFIVKEKQKKLFENIDKYGEINTLVFLIILSLFWAYGSGDLIELLIMLPAIIVLLVYKKNKKYFISIIIGLIYSTFWLFGLSLEIRVTDYRTSSAYILFPLVLFILSLVMTLLPIFWYSKKSSMQKDD